MSSSASPGPRRESSRRSAASPAPSSSSCSGPSSMSSESPLAWVAIDFLCCLLLVVYTLIAPPPKPASIDTLGQYAIRVTWPANANDDVDTYVQDPAGNIAWFNNSDVALMHLEHDDLGWSSDKQRHGGAVTTVGQN